MMGKRSTADKNGMGQGDLKSEVEHPHPYGTGSPGGGLIEIKLPLQIRPKFSALLFIYRVLFIIRLNRVVSRKNFSAKISLFGNFYPFAFAKCER